MQSNTLKDQEKEEVSSSASSDFQAFSCEASFQASFLKKPRKKQLNKEETPCKNAPNRSFDEYIKIEMNKDYIDGIMAYKEAIKKRGFNHCIKSIVYMYDIDYFKQGKESMYYYGCIISAAICIFKVLEEFDDKDNFNTMKTILNSFYEIDTLCGVNERMDRENVEHWLPLVDADLIKFKEIFKRNYILIDNVYGKQLFKRFGNLIFIFNNYQAPLRLSATKALEDSMGITDLFEEVYREIIVADPTIDIAVF